MQNKILVYGILVIALSVLVLCGLTFWGKFYPVKIFDMQFTAALQSGLISGFGLSAVLLFVVILLTLLFGRVYCSILCPLGLYQD